PFTNDPLKAETWELGYLAGFAEPETDHTLPLSEELLEVYQRGEQSGRDDRRRQPPLKDASGAPSESEHGWVSTVGEEALEHGILHAIGVGCEKIFGRIGGLIPLIITVIQIPGDVQLRPLEPEWEAPAASEEGNSFVAVCPHTDHPMVAVGV